jgi:hypothetical protein
LSATGFAGILIVVLFLGVILLVNFLSKDQEELPLRTIRGYDEINKKVSAAVENGTQLHLSLGQGGITGPESAATLTGLTLLKQVIAKSSVCDYPPLATTGNAVTSILAQDTILGTSQSISIEDQSRVSYGELVGITPYSYAVGTLTTIRDENVSANVFTGWFGSELIWLTTSGERQGTSTISGAAQLPAQAVLYASASDPLIGEELFVSGAYLEAGKIYHASVTAQDIFRWLIVGLILLGVLLNIFGLDLFIEKLLMGSL